MPMLSDAHAVLVLERALEYLAEDLHVSVRMRAETHARGDDIIVDHAERAEAHVIGIVVFGERKGVAGDQPPVIGEAAVGGAADGGG